MRLKDTNVTRLGPIGKFGLIFISTSCHTEMHNPLCYSGSIPAMEKVGGQIIVRDCPTKELFSREEMNNSVIYNSSVVP